MEAIKDTVTAVLMKLSAKKSNAPEDIPEEWLKKVLTKKELEHIKFKYLKKGLLALSVDSSSWLYMLSLEKEELLKELKKYSQEVKDINFRIGEVK
ncbi:MAG: DciA family protein [Candidatus Omnitrophota bacterium]|jgi:hypothetical protein